MKIGEYVSPVGVYTSTTPPIEDPTCNENCGAVLLTDIFRTGMLFRKVQKGNPWARSARLRFLQKVSNIIVDGRTLIAFEAGRIEFFDHLPG